MYKFSYLLTYFLIQRVTCTGMYKSNTNFCETNRVADSNAFELEIAQRKSALMRCIQVGLVTRVAIAKQRRVSRTGQFPLSVPCPALPASRWSSDVTAPPMTSFANFMSARRDSAAVRWFFACWHARVRQREHSTPSLIDATNAVNERPAGVFHAFKQPSPLPPIQK